MSSAKKAYVLLYKPSKHNMNTKQETSTHKLLLFFVTTTNQKGKLWLPV